jgi:hypothetical protein
MIEMISCSLREHKHAIQPLTSHEKDGMLSLATNAVCIPINIMHRLCRFGFQLSAIRFHI